MRLQIISIHAPPRGATNPAIWQGGHAPFQFTPLREGRLISLVGVNSVPISIHAPPRGATLTEVTSGDCGEISIHAPPRGATKIVETDCMLPIISIHAPPRGATWMILMMRELGSDFNSRPSARGDCCLWRRGLHRVFQFTPLREGRHL